MLNSCWFLAGILESSESDDWDRWGTLQGEPRKWYRSRVWKSFQLQSFHGISPHPNGYPADNHPQVWQVDLPFHFLVKIWCPYFKSLSIRLDESPYTVGLSPSYPLCCPLSSANPSQRPITENAKKEASKLAINIHSLQVLLVKPPSSLIHLGKL